MHKAEVIQEMTQIYKDLAEPRKISEEMEQASRENDAILRRKDKLLDPNISGKISDEEFAQRNRRFNAEIEALQDSLAELEGERLRSQEMMQSVETLRKIVTRELNFTDGFSPQVLDALLDHIDVGGGHKRSVQVTV